MILLLTVLHLCYGLDESKELHIKYPMQESKQSYKLLQEMQESIQTYLHQTPLSSYAYFDKQSAKLNSQAYITWIHGNIYLKTLATSQDPQVRATLNDEQYSHLGDYRYDLFTLLSDLLLKMQEDSDFSGSKEKAILGTLVEGYFDRLKDPKMLCPCIDDALIEAKESDLLLQYTKLKENKRHFKTQFEGLSKPNQKETQKITTELNRYLNNFNLLAIKDIAKDNYGNYLLLSEGRSDSNYDDMIFILSADTLPMSYYINESMKKAYLSSSQTHKKEALSSFNKTPYASRISINKQTFFINKLNPTLKLKPQSQKTRAYKKYAAALGYMLASFHANSKLKKSQSFRAKVNTQVKPRLVKTEMISMVYSYNETLENRWENFSDVEVLSLK